MGLVDHLKELGRYLKGNKKPMRVLIRKLMKCDYIFLKNHPDCLMGKAWGKGWATWKEEDKIGGYYVNSPDRKCW